MTLIDPPDSEPNDDEAVPHEVMREMAFATHFNWLAAFLGLPASPWRSRRTMHTSRVGDRDLVGGHEIRLEVAAGSTRTIVLGLAPEAAHAAHAGDMDTLDRLAVSRDGGDWLIGMVADSTLDFPLARQRRAPLLQ